MSHSDHYTQYYQTIINQSLTPAAKVAAGRIYSTYSARTRYSWHLATEEQASAIGHVTYYVAYAPSSVAASITPAQVDSATSGLEQMKTNEVPGRGKYEDIKAVLDASSNIGGSVHALKNYLPK
jgi:hypothetical protein